MSRIINANTSLTQFHLRLKFFEPVSSPRTEWVSAALKKPFAFCASSGFFFSFKQAPVPCMSCSGYSGYIWQDSPLLPRINLALVLVDHLDVIGDYGGILVTLKGELCRSLFYVDIDIVPRERWLRRFLQRKLLLIDDEAGWDGSNCLLFWQDFVCLVSEWREQGCETSVRENFATSFIFSYYSLASSLERHINSTFFFFF